MARNGLSQVQAAISSKTQARPLHPKKIKNPESRIQTTPAKTGRSRLGCLGPFDSKRQGNTVAPASSNREIPYCYVKVLLTAQDCPRMRRWYTHMGYYSI